MTSAIYARIMVKAVLKTMSKFLSSTIDYDETQRDESTSWRRGGINDFNMCSVFDSNLENRDDECDDDLYIDKADGAEYVGHGLFRIVADESLSYCFSDVIIFHFSDRTWSYGHIQEQM